MKLPLSILRLITLCYTQRFPLSNHKDVGIAQYNWIHQPYVLIDDKPIYQYSDSDIDTIAANNMFNCYHFLSQFEHLSALVNAHIGRFCSERSVVWQQFAIKDKTFKNFQYIALRTNIRVGSRNKFIDNRVHELVEKLPKYKYMYM